MVPRFILMGMVGQAWFLTLNRNEPSLSQRKTQSAVLFGDLVMNELK